MSKGYCSVRSIGVSGTCGVECEFSSNGSERDPEKLTERNGPDQYESDDDVEESEPER